MNIKKTIGLLALMAAAVASAADPLLRVSVDGGQTWQAWGDFTGALRYIIAEKNPTGTADENIIELCADTTGATFGQSYDRSGGLRYTLRSKTGEGSQRFTVSGSSRYVFKNQSGYDVVVSNIVFSGGTFTLAFNWSGAKMTLGPGFKVPG